jgi:adenylyltransferase/sulfurtransferase
LNLTEQQIERYSRHIILPEIGGTGQKKLLSAKVLIVGAGGLGSSAALYLAAAGVGTIGIVDGDRVDLTNLQRQVIHHTNDVGIEKVKSAKAKMNAINPDIIVHTHQELMCAENARSIIRPYDFVIDGTDNFPTKFLINDACYFEKTAFSHAGILRFDGQLITVIPDSSACYRCIFPSPPPPGAVPINTLMVYNALKMEFRKIKLNRNTDCQLCGENPSITRLIDEDSVVCEVKGSAYV